MAVMLKCNLERCIIEHCSPTLAGIKTAGLFSCGLLSERDMLEQVQKINKKLRHKDIVVSVMTKGDGRALIYVYRKSKLKAELERKEITEFLDSYGYTGLTPEKSVARLKQRLSESCDFPHEIGVFLGYPLEDVKGFIINEGKNCKCMGCWKVYSDECEAVKLFEKYKKCTDIYKRLHTLGRPVEHLTVRNIAAH